MRIKRALATALTVGALTLLTTPGADARGTATEAAAPSSVTAPAAVSPAALPAPDGYLYAWEHPHAGGFHCKWNLENANWAGCRNKVSDVWNNGYPGRAEDVRLFYGRNWTGSWVCLHQSHSLPDLGAHGLRFFSAGAGQGQLVNDNVSSHDWVDAC
ncbi:peptidase inhibitor family I36 protein [Streptomyces sp. NPDC058659]|uniref:peptidase inhibitor family I36 protein n=1 Tax=unclassified Streptomyces TaxID=2593676 RepID=UPI0036596FF3